MREFKLLCASMLLIASTTFFQSCSDSDEDACLDVVCEYDGTCDDGDCTCEDLTENYLIGNWEFDNAAATSSTFNAGNVYVDGFGNEVMWELDIATRTITITPGNKIIVSEDGFSCDRMNIQIDSGSSLTDFVLIRK